SLRRLKLNFVTSERALFIMDLALRSNCEVVEFNITFHKGGSKVFLAATNYVNIATTTTPEAIHLLLPSLKTLRLDGSVQPQISLNNFDLSSVE
ncbi:16309_t:CDS:2, partial [Acaulospora colombiana]